MAVYIGTVLSTLSQVASNDDGLGFGVQSQVSFNAVAGTTYQVAVDGFSPLDTGTINFHLNLPNLNPIITSQPQSTNVNQGQTVSFSVTATPAPLQYQWFFNATNLLPNATNSTLSISPASSPNSGIYSVLVTHLGHSVTSAPATLFVRLPVVVTTQPLTQIVDPGSNAVFSVTASGTPPLVYQWRYIVSGDDLITNIPGATNSTYAVINAQHTNAGFYDVRVSNIAGSTNSLAAELIVRPKIVQGLVLSNHTFQLMLNGTPGKSYTIETAGNMPGWGPLTTVTHTNVVLQYLDTNAPAASNRMYRLRLLPPAP